MNSVRVLVVDDEMDIRLGLRRLVESLGVHVVEAANGVEAVRALEEAPFDLVLTDLMMPEMGGAELLATIKQRWPKTTVVILTGFGTVQTAVACMQDGAAHFLTKPFENAEISRIVGRVGRRIAADRESGGQETQLVGEDPRMRSVVDLVDRIAPTPVSVLIEGESGVGKEVIARRIHERSAVAQHPLLAVNAAAMTDTLLESELFGHVRGAFTGADRDRDGIFAEACGGTVFLDEIASMSPAFQGKLLRVLQEKVVRPVGGSNDRSVEFRLLSASNRDLAGMVKDGEFREDLYYRMRVVSVVIPPLRDRPGDIEPLALHFLARAARDCLGEKDRVPELGDEALRVLKAHRWPGNVRELENAIQRAVVLCSGDRILPWHLGLEGGAEFQGQGVAGAEAESSDSYDVAKQRALERFQREFVCRALESSAGNVSHASRTCGLTRAAFQRILKQLGIDRSRFAKSV